MSSKQIRLGVEAREEGEWIDHPTIDGIELNVVSPQSEEIERMRDRLVDKTTKNGRKTIRQADSTWIFRQTRAACIKGIRTKNGSDVTDAHGEPFEFSADLMQQWVGDWPSYHPFFIPAFEALEDIGAEDTAAAEKSASDSPRA